MGVYRLEIMIEHNFEFLFMEVAFCDFLMKFGIEDVCPYAR